MKIQKIKKKKIQITNKKHKKTWNNTKNDTQSQKA